MGGGLFTRITFELFLLLSNGFVSACVGPVIDVQLHTSSTKHMTRVHNALLADKKDYPYPSLTLSPSVYDALLVIRPSILLRDSSSAPNSLSDNTHYIFSLPSNSTAWLSLIALNASLRAEDCIAQATSSDVSGEEPHSSASMAYSSDLTTLSTIFKYDLLGIDRLVEETVLGFTAVFFMSKSYSNFLICEASQLCYGGIVRSVALGTTDGLCTWRVAMMNTCQPVTVPVGRITLGRIFNVSGSSLDGFLEIPSSIDFSRTQFLGTKQSAHGYYSADVTEPIASSDTHHTIASITSPSAFTSCTSTRDQIRFFEAYSKCITRMEPSELHATCLYLCLSAPLLCLGLSCCSLKPILQQTAHIHHEPGSSWPLMEHEGTSPASTSAFDRLLGYSSPRQSQTYFSFNAFSALLNSLYFSSLPFFAFAPTPTIFSGVLPIHRTPAPLMSLSDSVTLFETGIKVVDLLTPYKKGGK